MTDGICPGSCLRKMRFDRVGFAGGQMNVNSSRDGGPFSASARVLTACSASSQISDDGKAAEEPHGEGGEKRWGRRGVSSAAAAPWFRVRPRSILAMRSRSRPIQDPRAKTPDQASRSVSRHRHRHRTRHEGRRDTGRRQPSGDGTNAMWEEEKVPPNLNSSSASRPSPEAVTALAYPRTP